MRILFVIFALMLSSTLFAEEAATPATEAALPALSEQLVLEIVVSWNDDTHPIINGTTNLPEGTLLEVFANPAESHEVSVKDGAFSVPLGDMDAGEYTVYASMLVPMSQPEEVKAIIGENGEKVNGEAATQPMTLVIK